MKVQFPRTSLHCKQPPGQRPQGSGFATTALALVAMLAISSIGQSAALEVYGGLPSIEDVAVSPDGSRLAFVRTKGDSRTIVIVSLPDGRGINTVQMGNNKLRSVTWADSDHLLITTSYTGQFHGPADSVWLGQGEWFQLTVFDLRKSAFKTLPDTRNNQALNIFGVLSGEVVVRRHAGHTILYLPALYSQSDLAMRILFRNDLETGEQSVERQGTSGTTDWVVDGDGQIVAERNYLEREQRWSLSIRRGKELSEILSGHEPIDVPEILGFGPDEETLLTSSVIDGENVWRMLSLKDGSLGQPLADGRALEDPIEDFRTSHMIGGRWIGDDERYEFFDDAMRQRWAAITRAFAGENLYLESYSADFNEIVVRTEGAKDGYSYQLVDMKAMRAQPLGEVYQNLGTPLEVQRLTYKAADGMEIPAYLTVPRGRAARNLPLVVLAHGGPSARDTADFDWLSQALADQGYAVLRANFRGSDLSWKFLSAGFGQWGRKMQTDLSDGVRYLADEGIIDPARVCIMGASYGGYAALAGVSLNPGVYRCAVSIAGISDLKRMLQQEDYHGSGGSGTWALRYWDRFLGVKGPADPMLDQISPIKHIDAVSVPVLLIHGGDDTVVAFKQSSAMFDALKRANKKVQLVELRREDHWLSRSETRLQMLQASVAFLRENNPPD